MAGGSGGFRQSCVVASNFWPWVTYIVSVCGARRVPFFELRATGFREDLGMFLLVAVVRKTYKQEPVPGTGRKDVLLSGMQQVREDVMGRVREARAWSVQHHRRQGEGSVLVQELAGSGAPPWVGRQGPRDHRHGKLALAQFSLSPPLHMVRSTQVLLRLNFNCWFQILFSFELSSATFFDSAEFL